MTYKFETRLQALELLLDSDDLFTTDKGANTPLYLQLEQRPGSFYCLWTKNINAIGNMEHKDCHIVRAGNFNELHHILAREYDIWLSSVPLEKWVQV
jgi:hypothetical protein